MIPTHNLSGVLPPFTGDSPVYKASVSPYPCSVGEFAGRFSSSSERAALLSGFLEYRAALLACGFTDGFQWVDGSFLENIEALKGRPPGDIDVVTLLHRPVSIKTSADWKAFVEANADLLFPQFIKSRFRCDAYIVDLDVRSDILVKDVYYWYGLFSHQRSTFLWKGMLEIPLRSDDGRALEILKELRDAEKI